MIRDRENTIVVSSRCDARDIATLIKAWEIDVGGRPRSTSWLLREVAGAMADLMVQRHGDAVKVETHQEAYEVIDGAQLNAHSTRSLRAITRGMQNEVLSPSTQCEPKKLQNDEMLLFAIKTMRQQGVSEEEIAERMAPTAASLEEQDLQRAAEERAKKDADYKTQMSKMHQHLKEGRIEKEQGLTHEQLFQNFTNSTVEMLEDFWETELQDRHVETNKQRYMDKWCPGATEDDYDKWLEPLLELARPKIESRAEDLRKLYEHQEREKKAKREAKAAVA